MTKTMTHIALLAACIAIPLTSEAGESKATESQPATKWKRAVKPKPLSKTVHKGLDWLVKHQLKNGGWGQGEESRNMGAAMAKQVSAANVADTCVATLALLRAGSTPTGGAHQKAINRAVDYVLAEIEESDHKDMYVTGNRGTRVQGKLGPYIDTFISAQLLAELKGKMNGEARETRVLAALDKVLTKIHRNQKEDGSWGDQGWAPALSNAVAGKAMNRASQAGAAVSEELREKSEGYASRQFKGAGKGFGKRGSAGVDLYAYSANVGILSDNAASNELEREQTVKALRDTKSKPKKAKLKAKLQRFDDVAKQQKAAEAALVAKLNDKRFVSGFGSNGGEEFLSYMLVSETLVAKGGKEWKAWDAKMSKNLRHIQNKDGSWTGHHCITGRTFVTAAALLVLTADRAPVPLASKIKRG